VSSPPFVAPHPSPAGATYRVTPGDARRTVLLLPLQSAALREMLIMARALREGSGYRPVFILREDSKYRGAPVEMDGFEVIHWDSPSVDPEPGTVVGGGDPKTSTRRSPTGRIRRHGPSFKSQVRAFLRRTLGDALVTGLMESVILARLLQVELRRARRICARLQPAAILLSGDRNILLEPALMRATQERGGLALVIPFAYSGRDDVAYMRRNEPLNRLEAPAQRGLKRWIARRYPQQAYASPYGRVLFFTPAVTLALARLGMLPPNPWAMGGGLSDRVAVSGEDDLAASVALGVPAAKIVVTGEPSHDELYQAWRERPRLRTMICEGYRLDAGRPLLIFAVPQLAEHAIVTWERHWEDIRFLVHALASSGASVLLSLHPKSDPEAYRFLETEFDARLLQEPLRAVLPAADVFVATFSSTVRWAVILEVPTVVVDLWEFRYDIYDHFAGVVKVGERAALADVVGRVVNDPATRERLVIGQRGAASRVAPFDGGACWRLIGLIDAHERQRPRRARGPAWRS
jgi:hypothetical protein